MAAIISTADALLQNGPWTKFVAGALETMRDAGFDALNMPNPAFEHWEKLFEDTVMTVAAIDRQHWPLT